jgi:hypothetical protein
VSRRDGTRLALTVALGAGLGAAVAAWGGPPAFAQQTVAVPDAAEAWYSTGPLDTCTSPVGCEPVSPPAPAYPSGTLHVAVTAGQTADVTYVQPDLAGLPSGEQAVSGTMTLPLATVSGNGNSDPSAATVEACLATGTFSDGTEGSTGPPPATDCSVQAPVEVGATAFSLRLDPFLAAWNGGKPDDGIALVPDPSSTTPTSDWHVAFNGRRLARAAHIMSSLVLEPAPGGFTPGESGAVPADPGSPLGGTAGSAPAGAGASPLAPAALPGVSAAPIVTPSVGAGQGAIASGIAPALAGPSGASGASNAASAPARTSTGAAVPTSFLAATGRGHGFQYPEVMLLPLVFAGGLVLVARMLTSDATPKRKPV